MPKSEKLNRREFITSAASIAATISIVPSSVIAGTGHVPPSDQLTVANIGCGTQGLREMGELLKNPKSFRDAVVVSEILKPKHF